MNKESRKISLQRAQELKEKTTAYREARKRIPIGLEMQDEFNRLKKKLLDYFHATEEDWKDWHWQMRNQIDDVNVLQEIINLSDEDKQAIAMVSEKHRWAVSPYYLSIMSPDNPLDPIRLMGLPSAAELVDASGAVDPMNEEFTNPAGSITRRYPDRLIINVTNVCANFCRFCQRRRNIGQNDKHRGREIIQKSIDYVKNNEEIRDVLITGGDALMLDNEDLEWIVSSLRAIPHVEVIRLGSRSLVTLPQRITKELCEILEKYHPIYINTHFNHPKEVTEDARKAADMLSKSGIPLGNQMVLLNGVNNDKYVVQALNHELLKIRVKPYYIFHTKQVAGTGHFICSVDEGLEIMEHLRGRTSGMAIPTYIMNAPGGLGKTPLLPTYVISRGKDTLTIRTWEGKTLKCKNRRTKRMTSILNEANQALFNS